MRSASTVLLLCILGSLAACKGEPFRPDAQRDAYDPDAYVRPWWTPEPGEAANWDIQLTEVDLTEQRAMIVLDLWDSVPSEQTITYADLSTVTVPAGVNATAIADLKARGTIVICQVNTGAVELDAPDAMRFPGWEADPPNRPDPPAAGSVIGWDTGDPNERYLDVRTAARAQWSELVVKRLELADEIGCDGIAPDHNDVFFYGTDATGFDHVSVPDQVTAWFREVAMHAHTFELSVGMRNGHYLPQGQPQELVEDFDWIMIERCAENQDCGNARPFADTLKAIFAIDYMDDGSGNGVSLAFACQEYANNMIRDGLYKTVALSGTFRDTCP